MVPKLVRDPSRLLPCPGNKLRPLPFAELLLERTGILVALGTPGRVEWNRHSLGYNFVKLNQGQTGLSMDFPRVFPIKVMGANQDDFENLVLSIIQKHAAVAEENGMASHLSRNGRFISLTVRIHALSQEQLDDIYRELSAHEKVLMML
jgi:putative lipoic acid-binding regulatory protein